MKRSTKTISIILIFFLIIAAVIISRTLIADHFKKKFSKIPPPGIIVTEVMNKEFSERIETFGTAISKKSQTFKIKKDDLLGDLELKDFVKKGDKLISLKGTLVPAKTLNKMISKIPVIGKIVIPKEAGEGLFGVSFKMKGPKGNLKTTINPIRTLTPRFIQKVVDKNKVSKQP